MVAICPLCGRDLFICQFCNSELMFVRSSLVEERTCVAHFCSSDCVELATSSGDISKERYRVSDWDLIQKMETADFSPSLT